MHHDGYRSKQPLFLARKGVQVVWGKTEIFVVVLIVAAVIGWLLLVRCERQQSWEATPAAVPTRSGEEVIATAQAKKTATQVAVSERNARVVATREATLEECNETAKLKGSVTAAAPELGRHSVTVRYPSLEVALRIPGIKYEDASSEAQSFMNSACLPLIQDSNVSARLKEFPDLELVVQAKGKASDLLSATVAPIVTATAAVHATAAARDATVRSRNVTFKCERLRLAYREVSALGSELAYRHVANVMALAPQAGNTYFDSYDAKTALQKCP